MSKAKFVGLKAALRDEKVPEPVTPPRKVAEMSTKAKAREGKKSVGGYFSPELSKTLGLMAVEENTTVQALLGEGIDLLLRTRNKHPFGER
jgi:hypothetical protein